MKKIYSLLLIALTSFSFGQTIMYEGFNYTVPGNVGGNLAVATDPVGSNNWFTHSNTATTGTGTIDVQTGNLSYTGIAASTGNKILLPGSNTSTPRDINRGFTSSTANALYYSLLINVIDNTQLSATASANGYFMSFGSTSGGSVTSLGGRLGIVSSNSGANYRLNISNISTGTVTYSENAVDLNFGTTYLVVVKFDRSTAPTVASLWVNPTSLGAAEPATTVTNNSGTSTFTAFASVCLRNSSATPKAEIDEIKVGATWADVTGLTLKTNQNSIAGLSIFPNPVKNGIFYINTNANAERTVTVFDVLGKQVLNTTTAESAINVNSLTSGVYMVKISEEGNTATRKLVIE
ncbi:MAG: T9SS type A sorting domain-containing protein [Flavobacteriaceae bacterium]|nr:T9SS type A sorting domain-containing protein [Flavobacteriaceae bacterium]